MEKAKLPKGWKVITYDDMDKKNKQKKIENKKEDKEEFEDSTFFDEDLEQPLYSKSYKTGKNEHGFFVSHYYSSSEPYWKRNLIPFLLEVGFVLSCFYIPRQYTVYTNFVFYLGLFIFYLITKSFSFKSLLVNLREGLYFWKETCITALLFCAAFAITEGLESLFSGLKTGFVEFKLHKAPEIIVFLISSLFLAPITEECFYRQGLISGESKKMLLLTSLVSIVLFAVAHAFSIWGIFLCMLWALPLTWAYLKTRNIYIVITAHFIVNVIGNIPPIIASLIK